MDVQQRIILASIELMGRQGVKQTTMDDVAQYLSISKRTIYEKFEDKVGLIIAVMHHIYQKTEQSNAEIMRRSANVIEELFEILKSMESDFLVRGRITKDIERHYPDVYQNHCLPQFEKIYFGMTKTVEQGIADGLFEGWVNARFTVFQILESINAMLNNFNQLQASTGVTPFETVRLIFVNIFRGIATKNGVVLIDTIIKEQGGAFMQQTQV